MFCYQCEQTAGGTGCTVRGVCGKDPEAAALQDLLVYATQGLAVLAHRARAQGITDAEVDAFVPEALFAAGTNVNFDPERLEALLRRAVALRDRARGLVKQAKDLPPPATWEPAGDRAGLLAQAADLSIAERQARLGEDVTGLQELLLYGLKGMAAYAYHARVLGHEDDAVYAYFHEALDFLAGVPTDIGALLGMALRCGEVNLHVMELLDAANTGAYGHPVPTAVRVEPVAGKAILVSGHDLKDLEELLKQTAGLGINVYTHGEMLPAHGYPKLKAYAHLAGNYGGAWQDQQAEFAAFPGAILMTTNCIQRPQEVYGDRIFTCGPVAWPEVRHIADRDFSPVIEAAQAAEGFAASGPDRTLLVGFGHEALLGAADAVLGAVKSGAVRHIFLIGGCDGARPGRNYYTELAEATPPDTLILTLACGKYRFNKLDFGEVAGLPRLLDVGQCNDAYSAIKVAAALAEAVGTDVNGLPLSLILSWYEQKAVAILLTLLHLGVRNIRLGPSLPAFVTPAALSILAEKYNIMPITTPQEDLKAILG